MKVKIIIKFNVIYYKIYYNFENNTNNESSNIKKYYNACSNEKNLIITMIVLNWNKTVMKKTNNYNDSFK